MTDLTPEHVRESNLIEGIDDPVADEVGWAAWLWLDGQEEIAPWTALVLHRLVTCAQLNLPERFRGAWRRHNVEVGGKAIGEHWRGVPEAMQSWCSRLSWSVSGDYATSSPRELHVEFEQIHPFADGNGRVGRLLLWWHEDRIGQPPTLLRAAERQKYYRWFRGER